MSPRPSVGRARAPLATVDDLEEIVALVRKYGQVFVRYSKGPDRDASQPSHDYESGLDLPGLSVTSVTPEPWWTRPVEDWVARRLCKYEELGEEDRFPWLLVGRIVGTGPDHEPLLDDVVPLARVSPAALAQARNLYAERFDVGRDSRSSTGPAS